MSAATVRAGRTPRRLPAFLPVLAATVLLFLLCAVFVPRTIGGISLQAMIPYAAILAIAAAGQTLIIQQRGIDLSVGGMVSLSATGVPALTQLYGFSTIPAILVMLLSCIVAGLVNGLLVSRLRITPLVATLAVNALLVGAVAAITHSAVLTTNALQIAISTTPVLGQPVLVWVAVVVVAVIAFVSVKTATGRRFTASGVSPEAATVSAIDVDRNLLGAYMLGGLTYGIAGVLLSGYLVNPGTNVGTSYILSVIATVIVGGTALTGGRGTIVGSAIAAVFLTQLVQAVLTLGAPSSIQLLIQAIAIAAAATLQGLSLLRRRRRPSKPTAPLSAPTGTPLKETV